jgi:hypothetical protein
LLFSFSSCTSSAACAFFLPAVVWRGSQVVRQGSAKALSPVRFRPVEQPSNAPTGYKKIAHSRLKKPQSNMQKKLFQLFSKKLLTVVTHPFNFASATSKPYA